MVAIGATALSSGLRYGLGLWLAAGGAIACGVGQLLISQADLMTPIGADGKPRSLGQSLGQVFERFKGTGAVPIEARQPPVHVAPVSPAAVEHSVSRPRSNFKPALIVVGILSVVIVTWKFEELKRLVFASNGKANSRASMRDVDEPEIEFQDRPNRREISIDEEAHLMREKAAVEQDIQAADTDWFRLRDALPVDEHRIFLDQKQSWTERRRKVITSARKTGQDRWTVPRPDVDDVLKAIREGTTIPVTTAKHPGSTTK